MSAAAAKRNPQVHLLERRLDDQELLIACQHVDEAANEWKEKGLPLQKTVKQYNEQVEGCIKRLGLPEGTYVVGEFRFEVKQRSGGGFKVDAWTKLTFNLSLPLGDSSSSDGSSRAD